MKKLLTTAFIFLTSILPLLAQPGLPTNPDQAPIDGGLIWLLIGGGVYGIKKLRDRNKSITEQ